MTLQAHIIQPADQAEPITTNSVAEAAHLFRVHGTLMLENSFDPVLVQDLQADFMGNYASRDRTEVERTCLRVGLD